MDDRTSKKRNKKKERKNFLRDFIFKKELNRQLRNENREREKYLIWKRYKEKN